MASLTQPQAGIVRNALEVEPSTHEKGRFDLCLQAGDEHSEAVMVIRGFIVDANLPPITSRVQCVAYSG